MYINDPIILRRSITAGPDSLGDKRPKASPLNQTLFNSGSPPNYSQAISARSSSDSQLPLYRKSTVDTDDAKSFDNSRKPKAYQPPPITSVSDIQASIRFSVESALLPMAGRAFDGSEFAKAVNDEIQRASMMLCTKHSSHAVSIQDTLSRGNPAARITSEGRMSNSLNTACSASTDCTEIHHYISATETVFGTIWLRTSTKKVIAHFKAAHVITSFVYFPSWWLTKFGFKNGIGVSLSNSAKGWQVSLNPFRAVPDDTLIFDFCKAGNIKAVQRLLSRGDASVQDTSSKGWTPLHVSYASCSDPNRIEPLVIYQLDCSLLKPCNSLSRIR